MSQCRVKYSSSTVKGMHRREHADKGLDLGLLALIYLLRFGHLALLHSLLRLHPRISVFFPHDAYLT